MKVKGWLAVAAVVAGLTVWGWSGPAYPAVTAPHAAVVAVHVGHAAPGSQGAAGAASGGQKAGGHHATRALSMVLRAHRVIRWAFRPRLRPWWLG